MGNAIWIQTQDKQDAPDSDRDLIYINDLSDLLDMLCEKMGVTEIVDFHDYSEMAKEFEEEFKEAGINEPDPEAQWYDPEPALTTFNALISALEKDFSQLEYTPEGTDDQTENELMDELRYCQTFLQNAIAVGQKFRLLILM